jgi:hypothetical protein
LIPGYKLQQIEKPPLSRRKATKAATFPVENGYWLADART